ncbi:MAG: hypothetical protein HGB35_00295 [Geobacteraceae bacterium]|nr:hypothetical protein [Geobacteraceae bacterium]
MGFVLNHAASPVVLVEAWRRYAKAGSIQCTGVGKRPTETIKPPNLSYLAEEIRSGNYRPDPVSRFVRHKPNGGSRLITVFTIRDRIAQRAVLKVLTPFGEQLFHPDSFGFRPGRSVAMATRRAEAIAISGRPWLLHTDIYSCFEMIEQDRLRRLLQRLVPDQAMVLMVARWLSKGGSESRGIPQGGPLSPFLCNLYLNSVDYALTRHGINFVRYGDDLLLLAESRDEARAALGCLSQMLEQIGLALNRKKSRIFHYGDRARFLGRDLPEEYLAAWLEKEVWA